MAYNLQPVLWGYGLFKGFFIGYGLQAEFMAIKSVQFSHAGGASFAKPVCRVNTMAMNLNVHVVLLRPCA